MTTSFGARSLLFAVPCLLAVAAWAMPPAGDATPEQGAVAELAVNNCTYYNNAAHSKVVGQFGYDCCNNPVAWGKKTQYSSCGGCFPCFPPPR